MERPFTLQDCPKLSTLFRTFSTDSKYLFHRLMFDSKRNWKICK